MLWDSRVSLDFAREIHPLHLGQLEVLLSREFGLTEFAHTLTQLAIKSLKFLPFTGQKRKSCGHNETKSDKIYLFLIL